MSLPAFGHPGAAAGPNPPANGHVRALTAAPASRLNLGVGLSSPRYGSGRAQSAVITRAKPRLRHFSISSMPGNPCSMLAGDPHSMRYPQRHPQIGIPSSHSRSRAAFDAPSAVVVTRHPTAAGRGHPPDRAHSDPPVGCRSDRGGRSNASCFNLHSWVVASHRAPADQPLLKVMP